MQLFNNIKQDLPASIIVFFVALPLCLGIALASGAPLFSGVIAGIVGGVVVGAFSGSPLGVSGPAAGLANELLVLAEQRQAGQLSAEEYQFLIQQIAEVRAAQELSNDEQAVRFIVSAASALYSLT